MYYSESFFYEIRFVPLINDRVIYWKALCKADITINMMSSIISVLILATRTQNYN